MFLTMKNCTPKDMEVSSPEGTVTVDSQETHVFEVRTLDSFQIRSPNGNCFFHITNTFEKVFIVNGDLSVEEKDGKVLICSSGS